MSTTTPDEPKYEHDPHFFQKFGGGMRKALNKRITVKVAGQEVGFTAANTEPVQKLLDDIVMENDRLYLENEKLRMGAPVSAAPAAPVEEPAPTNVVKLPKPRISVRAATEIIEIWAKMPDADPRFEVSNRGRFRDIITSRILPVYSQNGMQIVHVHQTAGVRRTRIRPISANAAKMVGLTFCSRPIGAIYLHFKDRNRKNLAAENLVWITDQDPRLVKGVDVRCKGLRAIDAERISA